MKKLNPNVSEVINDLLALDRDEGVEALIVLADTQSGTSVKVMLDGISSQELFALIGTIEQLKLRLLSIASRGGMEVDDDDAKGMH